MGYRRSLSGHGRRSVAVAGAPHTPTLRRFGGTDRPAGSFRLYVKSRESEIARLRLEAAQKLAEQQKLMLEARRRCRLLERLKERRFTAWTATRDREVEEIAAESYLARWGRRKPVA
jgi:hypothetical protein